MAGGCCGGKKAQAASVAAPYEVTLPDGKKVTVENKTQERVEMDKAWARMRLQAKKDGFRVVR
jgi:hypothetical protein